MERKERINVNQEVMHDLRNQVYALNETDQDLNQPQGFINIDLTYNERKTKCMSIKAIEMNEIQEKEAITNMESGRTKETLGLEDNQHLKFIQFKMS